MIELLQGFMARDPEVESPTVVPIDNPLDRLLGYQLRRASQAMLADLVSSLDGFSLRPTGVSVLLLVAGNPGITQSRIGQILAVERANMVPMTAALAKRGLLMRSRTDGRSQGLHLTDEGKTAVAKIRKRIAKHEEKFWRGAKSSERDKILTFLKALWEDSGATP